jgi:cytoskeleton protein RodZ
VNAAADANGDRHEPGSALAAERERQNLSRADIAQRLRMSVSQVEALELGDYTRLPRGTFLRGFVRNYARVLGLEPETVLRALSEDAPSHSRPGIVVASQNIRFDPIGQRLSNPYVKAAGLATVAVVIAFAVMYWWLFVRPALPANAAARKSVAAEAVKPPAPRAEAPVAEPPRLEPRVTEPPVAIQPIAKAEPPKPEPVKPEPSKAAAKADAAKAAAKSATAASAPVPAAVPEPSMVQASASAAQPLDAAAVLAAGGSVIRLKFKGSSWVEIKDGRGKMLLSRVNAAGSEAEVVGKGPFSVIVGNAPEVSMTLNDRPFDLEPHTRVAVARFTTN